jgi:GT2 family glycosyltransferase
MTEATTNPIPPAPVTAVIPTFNRAADLERALAHLACQSVGPMHAIVVDNSSSDDTPARVQRIAAGWDGRMQYIRRTPNGPAAARNTGLAAATTPYVLFLDSDVDLPPDWVERALGHLGNDPALAAVGGYILYGFDMSLVNAYGGDLGQMGLAWDVDEGESLDKPREPAARIWVNCSAMLGRASAIRALGGFDETFFYGYEDSDLGWRLNLAGHRVAVFPDLRAKHNVSEEVGLANPEIVFHYCKNRLRSLLKNASAASLVPRLGAYAAYTVADLVARAPRAAKLRALAWNAARLGETLALRRATQQLRVLPDGKVFAHGSMRWFPPSRLGGLRRRAVHGQTGPSASRAAPADDRV